MQELSVILQAEVSTGDAHRNERIRRVNDLDIHTQLRQWKPSDCHGTPEWECCALVLREEK